MSFVNLHIANRVGYVNSIDAIVGPIPNLETIKNLDGKSSVPVILNSKVLDIRTTGTFIIGPGSTSHQKQLVLSNLGNATLTISSATWTSDGATPIFNFNAIPPIAADSSYTLNIAYKADYEEGNYVNVIIFESDNDAGDYQIFTEQEIIPTYGCSITPPFINTTSTLLGHGGTFKFDVVPLFNDIPTPSVISPVTASMSGSPAWKVVGTGDNTVSVKFEPDEVNNIKGIYRSTVTITSNGETQEIPLSGTINVDAYKNKNLAKWISPVSYYNSIIGISYDLENDQRVLTIGVGMGADGSPIYGEGGSSFVDLNAIGLKAETANSPYPYWAYVCKIKFTGQEKIYKSSDYVVKTTDGLNYGDYFGEYNAPGSMFIIEDDGYGSLKIELNHLSKLSDDDVFNITLKNLTNAFYYYADGRYMQSNENYSTPVDVELQTTNFFVGFNYNTLSKKAFVNTSIVEIPSSDISTS